MSNNLSGTVGSVSSGVKMRGGFRSRPIRGSRVTRLPGITSVTSGFVDPKAIRRSDSYRKMLRAIERQSMPVGSSTTLIFSSSRFRVIALYLCLKQVDKFSESVYAIQIFDLYQGIGRYYDGDCAKFCKRINEKRSRSRKVYRLNSDKRFAERVDLGLMSILPRLTERVVFDSSLSDCECL